MPSSKPYAMVAICASGTGLPLARRHREVLQAGSAARARRPRRAARTSISLSRSRYWVTVEPDQRRCSGTCDSSCDDDAEHARLVLVDRRAWITFDGSSQSNCTFATSGLRAHHRGARRSAMPRTVGDVLARHAELHREADRRAVLQPGHARRARPGSRSRSSSMQPRAHAPRAPRCSVGDEHELREVRVRAAAGRAAGRSAGCRCPT